MRVPLLGLTVPLLLLTAAFAVMSPPATAQDASYTISGKVTSDAGAPLEGVRVNAYTYYADRTRSSTSGNAEDVTDADGRYTLTLASGKGWINIYYEKWRQGDGREIDLTSDQAVDFTLKTPPPRDAILTGVVRGPDGKPIEGAEVSLQYACCYAMPADATVVTDPPAPEGNTTTASDNATEGASGEGSSASGVSYARPAIAIYPPYYDDYQTTTTGADGVYRFEAYAGPRSIVAWAKGYAQTTIQTEAKSGETVTVDIDLEKVPEKSAVLTGRVVDATTGLPLAGAQVSVRSLEWGRYAWAETGTDGSYRITMLPGWTEISVNHYPRYEEPVLYDGEMKIAMPRPVGTQYYPYATVTKLASGENDLDVKLDSKPKPTIALLGYVLDPDTKTGIEGARVSVWSQDTGDWGEAITDATGSYKIMVRAGHFTANAWKDGYLSGQQSFIVEGDDATKRMNLLMPKGVTKWAPCYDETDCGGPIMYAKEGDVRSTTVEATATPVPPGYASTSGSSIPSDESRTGAPAPALAAADAQQDGTSGAAGPDRTSAATFTGSGGGLPPYDPNSADDGATLNGAEGVEPGTGAPVPGLGLAALLGVLALGALVLSRRK